MCTVLLLMTDAEKHRDLKAMRSRILVEFDESRAQLAELQKRIIDSEERLTLVDRLISLESGVSDPLAVHPTADTFLDHCEQIILQVGRPMHVKELQARLLDTGVPIPGRGTEANLITRLQRSDGRFVRTGRGTYAPASLGVPAVKPARQKRVRTRKS